MRILGFTPRELADVATIALFGTALAMLLVLAAVCLWRAALPTNPTPIATASGN